MKQEKLAWAGVVDQFFGPLYLRLFGTLGMRSKFKYSYQGH